MQLQNMHFNPDPWPWEKARAHLCARSAGGTGGQGAVFSCGPALEGSVVKLYNKPRSASELARVQSLIHMCRGLSPELPGTIEWFKRLNLPLRPVMSPDGGFGGVVLPPLPAEVNAKEYRYDHKSSRLIAQSTHVQFEAQFLTRKMSPVGHTTEQWQWRLLNSLAETVALMHSANLVHGDLSLTNVLAQQKDEAHLNDSVYLIDIDDAFLSDGKLRGHSVVRKSRYTYDPYSFHEQQVSKETDVFVVALWVVAFMQYKFDIPEVVAQNIPPSAITRLRKADKKLLDVVKASLGSMESRPTMLDLYLAIRQAAQKMGGLS